MIRSGSVGPRAGIAGAIAKSRIRQRDQRFEGNDMRVAAGLIFAVSLCAPGVAWSQSAPTPQPAAAAPTGPATAAFLAATSASASAQPARPACTNPNALGVARTVEIDT